MEPHKYDKLDELDEHNKYDKLDKLDEHYTVVPGYVAASQ